MDRDPLYISLLLALYVFPTIALLLLRSFANTRIPTGLMVLLITIPPFIGALVYAAFIFPTTKIHSARTFITIALTVFLFTVVPDGIWSSLFGQVEWMSFRQYSSGSYVRPTFLILISMAIGGFAGVCFHAVDTYSLYEVHTFYHLTEGVITAQLPGAVAYASGGAMAGLLAAYCWVTRGEWTQRR